MTIGIECDSTSTSSPGKPSTCSSSTKCAPLQPPGRCGLAKRCPPSGRWPNSCGSIATRSPRPTPSWNPGHHRDRCRSGLLRRAPTSPLQKSARIERFGGELDGAVVHAHHLLIPRAEFLTWRSSASTRWSNDAPRAARHAMTDSDCVIDVRGPGAAVQPDRRGEWARPACPAAAAATASSGATARARRPRSSACSTCSADGRQRAPVRTRPGERRAPSNPGLPTSRTTSPSIHG